VKNRKMLNLDSITGNICLPQNSIAKVYELQQCEFYIKMITNLGWVGSRGVNETRMKTFG
jgi:hypothetical protein